MRFALAALALLGLAACDGAAVDANGSQPDGYRLEVRAIEGVQTYLITAPDGKVVGAQAADGASRLLSDSRIQEIAAEPMPADEDAPPQVMSLKLPGFEMSVNANHDENGEVNSDDGNAQVRIRTRGQETVSIDARDGGPGPDDDIAHVVITGASEQSVREFIDEQDDLSADVKQQMRTALGLT